MAGNLLNSRAPAPPISMTMTRASGWPLHSFEGDLLGNAVVGEGEVVGVESEDEVSGFVAYK